MRTDDVSAYFTARLRTSHFIIMFYPYSHSLTNHYVSQTAYDPNFRFRLANR